MLVARLLLLAGFNGGFGISTFAFEDGVFGEVTTLERGLGGLWLGF